MRTSPRFFAYLEQCRGASDACWNWPRTSGDGYGHVIYKGRLQASHRATYDYFVGPIPPGLQIDHLCRNRACCNPAHLEAVTPRENTMRSNALGALNARKSHCAKGHPYTDESWYTQPGKNPRRICKQCRREQFGHRDYVPRERKQPEELATHCQRGHEFTPENTYRDKRGWRFCRECARARGRVNDAKRRKRAA